jgi:hypothetical protein
MDTSPGCVNKGVCKGSINTMTGPIKRAINQTGYCNKSQRQFRTAKIQNLQNPDPDFATSGFLNLE